MNMTNLFKEFSIDRLKEEKWYAEQQIQQYVILEESYFKNAILNHNIEKIHTINNLLEVKQWTK